MIQRLLTQPRQATLPGQSNQPPGQTIGGGIAGVASTADEDGIKIYNEHSNYKEWEFLYDFTKDKGPVGAQGGPPNGTPASELGTPAGQQPGQPGQPVQNSPFGQQPGGGFPSPGMGSPGMGSPMQPPRR
jgi:hypothetical protein